MDEVSKGFTFPTLHMSNLECVDDFWNERKIQNYIRSDRHTFICDHTYNKVKMMDKIIIIRSYLWLFFYLLG